MKNIEWAENITAAVTICNLEGEILYMNKNSRNTFNKENPTSLVGQNLYDCHPEPSKTKLKELMDCQQDNIYTIEKKGVKKLIYQTPWYEDGIHQGLVELSIVLPNDMPHFVRT